MKKITLNRLALAIASVGVVVMSGCGGGSDGTAAAPSSLSISGVAATGAAISGGAVTAKCASGTGTATTNSDGSYTLTVSNGTLPCLLRVLVPNTTIALHSAVEPGSTTANISPLTQLVVANALGADPATVYAGGVSTSTATNLSSTALTAAVGNIQAAVVSLGLSLGIDPLKAALVAATEATAGNAQDKQIDGLMAALNNANLKITDLSAALQTPTTTTAAAAAVTTFATTNAVSTSALTGCPSARSGRYRFATPGDNRLGTTYINFSSATLATNDVSSVSIPSMSGITYGSTTSLNNTYTVAQSLDANNAVIPCAFKFTMTSALNGTTIGAVINIRLSAAGLGVFSEAGTAPASFPNPIAVAMSTNAVGLFIPVQALPTPDQLAGTSYGMHYSLPVGSTVTQNFYSKFVIASNGTSTTPGTSNTATAYLCTGLGVCDTTPTNTFTFTRDTAKNLITIRSTIDPTDTVMSMFRNQLGDFVGLGVNSTASTTWTNNYAVFSNRVSPYTDRAVGSQYRAWIWSIANNGTSGALAQSSIYRTFTVNSVINNSATDRSFTRTSDASPSVVIDTILLNNPIVNIGMIRRPAVTASATTAAAKDFVGFTGNGWTIAGGTKLNATAPSYTDANVANNFLSFSIQAN